jgi:hypothetical protein
MDDPSTGCPPPVDGRGPAADGAVEIVSEDVPGAVNCFVCRIAGQGMTGVTAIDINCDKGASRSTRIACETSGWSDNMQPGYAERRF